MLQVSIIHPPLLPATLLQISHHNSHLYSHPPTIFVSFQDFYLLSLALHFIPYWGWRSMDFGRRLLLSVLFLHELISVVKGNVVFDVQHKYAGSRRGITALRQLRSHDLQRHGRMLGAVDFPLGGDGSPTGSALFYTKITIGTPPVEYHVQVDTGSDILWVNCKNCEKCATKTALKIKLQQYDPKASSTSKTVSCDQEVCNKVFNNMRKSECKAGANCFYALGYGDGSVTEGNIVSDIVQFDQVSGNRKVSPMNSTVAFGCSSKISGQAESSSEAVDGIIGFGQSNGSTFAQLASAGKAKKVFSHCLDKNGGGIYAIGEVVEPKVNSTPLMSDSSHYNAEVKGIVVGGKTLELPKAFFGLLEQTRVGIIDSGSTLTYLPTEIYNMVMEMVMAQHKDMKVSLVDNTYKCLSYKGKVDDAFPAVNFQFDKSLSLTAYPRDYLFPLKDDEYCFGWLPSPNKLSKNGKETFIFGDNLLSNKLVVYDVENRTVGWADYQCSSSIKVKDEGSGNVYEVSSHKLSGSTLLKANVISVLASIAAIFFFF